MHRGDAENDAIRPHRKDGYAPRVPVKIRVNEETLARLDGFASALNMSRAHACDVVIAVAMHEGADFFQEAVRSRVAEALDQKRLREWGS